MNSPLASQWVKSSYSGPEGGNCLEWAPAAAASGLVPIRDSKVPDGPILVLPDTVWDAFIGYAKGHQV